MSKAREQRLCGAAWAALLLLQCFLTGCQGFHSSLDPAGPMSGQIYHVIHIFFWVSVVVYVLVVIFSLLAIARMRSRVDLVSDPITIPPAEANRRQNQVIAALVVLTAIILFGLMLVDFMAGRKIHAFAGSDNQLVISVTGHQWWWEVQYQDATPSNIVTTANEIHIPVGRPIKIELKSGDVIHSFWVPNLHGKKDAFPDHDTAIWLRADREGEYDGQCAEFCGYQHAQMRMQVIAEGEQKFQQWLQNQRKSAPDPSNEMQRKGQQVFLSTTCVMCHTIQGTNAGARLGPNLTHVASRKKIASGTLPNTTGHLAGWIVDPQKVKPGVRMPQNVLSPEDLRALLEYVQSLK
ncbi:MAG TPA: cytochrome c oxidase subunit II [Tepidisphaeraceae bacterium]|nr:cytochrome c oxidase subunit II [Tepidisphaeraceae bacterium]